MGKLFDALCVFLVLLAAAPRFSRGEGCKRSLSDGGVVECASFQECILGGENENGDVTRVDIVGSCEFGEHATVAVTKDLVISGINYSAVLVFADKTSEIHFGRNLTFRKIGIGSKTMGVWGTVNMFSSANVSSVSIYTSYFAYGMNMVFKTFVHVTVNRTDFNLWGDGPTMLEIEKGSLDLSRGCVLCDGDCKHATIKVNICHNTTIHDSAKIASVLGNAPVFEFSPCVQAVESVPTLKIHNIEFEGEGTNASAWIVVRGDDVKGPMVSLFNNYYSSFDMEASSGANDKHMGRFFRFIALERSDVQSKFTLSAGSANATSWFAHNMHLATKTCDGIDGHDIETRVLPVVRTEAVQQYDLSCPCCYAENDTGVKRFGGGIAACLTHAESLHTETVHVMGYCRIGEPESPTVPLTISTSNSLRKMTREEGDNPFVNNSNAHPIVCRNIHFKRAIGAGGGVAKILLGSQVATGVSATVEMVGCIVDKDVVVKLLHNVHFTATNTTFNQGTKESVLSFAAAETLSATVGDCTFNDMECKHEMITGYSCGNVKIKNTTLVKGPQCNKAAIKLSPCASNDNNKPATVKLEKLNFRGEIEDEYDGAWIKVQGNHNGPIVTLRANNYTNINAGWRRPRFYEFTVFVPQAERDTALIKFSITKEQTERSVLTGKELAVVAFYESETSQLPYERRNIFPINQTERQVYSFGL